MPRFANRAISLALGLILAILGPPALAQLEVLEVDENAVTPTPPLSPRVENAPKAEIRADTAQAKAATLPAASLESPTDSAALALDTAVTPADTKVPVPSTVSAPVFDSGFSVEVDRDLGKNADKSLALALLGSALLPGTGEVYLREPGQARPFLLVEAGFWAGVLMSWWARDGYLQSARNQASEFAGIDASDKGEGFLNTMAEYRSYLEKEHRNDSYEFAQILAGKRDRQYDIAAIPENYWDFGSSNTPENTRNWKTFQSTLRYYRASKVALTFAVGGLALNRLAAMAHTLRLYRKSASKGLGMQALPEIGPHYAGIRLALPF